MFAIAGFKMTDFWSYVIFWDCRKQFRTKRRPVRSTDVCGESRQYLVQRDQLGRTLIPPIRVDVSGSKVCLPPRQCSTAVHPQRHTYCSAEIMKIMQTFFCLWLVVEIDCISLICFISWILIFLFLYQPRLEVHVLSIFNHLFLWNLHLMMHSARIFLCFSAVGGDLWCDVLLLQYISNNKDRSRFVWNKLCINKRWWWWWGQRY